MATITPAALLALLKGKGAENMAFVRVKERRTQHRYEGRIINLDMSTLKPENASVSIEATDGEVVWKVPVRWIEWVDIRPFQAFSGYSVTQFVDDFAQTG
jgi:hypothetical protein